MLSPSRNGKHAGPAGGLAWCEGRKASTSAPGRYGLKWRTQGPSGAFPSAGGRPGSNEDIIDELGIQMVINGERPLQIHRPEEGLERGAT